MGEGEGDQAQVSERYQGFREQPVFAKTVPQEQIHCLTVERGLRLFAARRYWTGQFDFPMPFFLGHMIPAGKNADLTRYHVGVCDVSVLVKPSTKRHPEVYVTISERPDSVGSVAHRFEYIATDVVRLMIHHILYESFPVNKIRWFLGFVGMEESAKEVLLSWDRKKKRFTINKRSRFPVPKAKEIYQGAGLQEALLLRQLGGGGIRHGKQIGKPWDAF